MHNHHDSTTTLPPGWVDQNNSTSGNWGWACYLLPMLEQGNMYRSIAVGNQSLGATLDDVTRFRFLTTPMPMFRCPSDTAPEINSQHTVVSATGQLQAITTSNYVGANGGGDWTYDVNLAGTFGRNSKTRIRDFADGTSNTIVVGERAWVLPNGTNGVDNCRAAVVFGVSADQSAGTHTQRHVLAKGLFGINQTGNDTTVTPVIELCARSFSSGHIGGAQFLMGDGSVRFISENIQRDQELGNGNFIWQNLLNKADYTVIGVF